MSAAPRGGPSLEEARSRLRDLGYLDGRVERFLFRRAFEGRGALFLPALLAGAFAASLAELAAVESGEPGFGSSVAAMGMLLAHLFAANLLPALLAALALTLAADRSRAPGAHGTATGLAAAGLVFILWIGGTYELSRDLQPRALLWGAPVAMAALFLARSVRSGFLARAYARSRTLPDRPRRPVFFAASVLALLAAAAIFAARPGASPPAAPRPSPRPAPVVVLAVDGLELDGAGRGDPVAALLGRARTGWWPGQRTSPPELWTSLATGVPASRHGVRALERVRPRGSPLALRPPLGAGWYLRGLAPALDLATSAPVSAADREALSFWEIAASAGLPSLAVGWWASGPWPGSTVIENREILAVAADGLEADRRAIARFERERAGGCAVCALYLPGCDILRDDPTARARARGEVGRFLQRELARARAAETALVVLSADSHPPAGALGRMSVFDGPATPRTARIRPEDVLPSLVARAGIPAARDLPGHPMPALFADGTLERATVGSYGSRVAPAASHSPASDREYLEKLRSLGYLN